MIRPASPLPWEHDTHGQHSSDEVPYTVLIDADGKTIADTLNSDVAVIHTEHDEDGATRWDETGRENFAFICRAANSFESLVKACKAMRATMYSPHSEESILADAALALAEGK